MCGAWASVCRDVQSDPQAQARVSVFTAALQERGWTDLYLAVDIDYLRLPADNDAVTEHGILGVLLIFAILQVGFVGYLVYRVVRKSDPLEGMIAATYLQARKFLEQQSQSR